MKGVFVVVLSAVLGVGLGGGTIYYTETCKRAESAKVAQRQQERERIEKYGPVVIKDYNLNPGHWKMFGERQCSAYSVEGFIADTADKIILTKVYFPKMGFPTFKRGDKVTFTMDEGGNIVVKDSCPKVIVE